MKKNRAEKKNGPLSAPPFPDASSRTVVVSHAELTSQPPLLERWRRLATGLRGVRLFRVTVLAGNKLFWQAECMLQGGWVCRRFASELHARAWLSVANQPHSSLSSVEQKELSRPFSSSCFASGG